jgi:hypothetical protein
MLEWPSQSETFRRSFVACRIVIAQVCLETCGDTRFDAREEQRFSAMRTYFRRMYSNPARVIHPLRALINSSGTRTSPLTESQARIAEAISVHSGTNRLSTREFPGSRDRQVPMSDPMQKVLGCPNVLARRHPLITDRSQFLGEVLQ